MHKRNLFSLLSVAVCLLLALCVTAHAQTLTGACGENLTYTLDTDTGKLVISGTGRMDYGGMEVEANAPWYGERDSIRTVLLEDGATSIGVWAFSGCTSLTSITIPDSVTTIGDYAFYGCTGLQTTDGDLRYIRANNNPHFYLAGTTNKEVTSCTIHPDTRFIGRSAFSGCTSLTEINLPDSVTTIGDHAFSWCTSLTEITIPYSVTTIGSNAFFGCTSLTEIAIPDSATSIGEGAFRKCTSLTSITIPYSVTSIGADAFHGCYNLTVRDYSGLLTEAEANRSSFSLLSTTPRLSSKTPVFLFGAVGVLLVAPSASR